jgi:TonB-linked SusC/RagA family outer membrane protein
MTDLIWHCSQIPNNSVDLNNSNMKPKRLLDFFYSIVMFLALSTCVLELKAQDIVVNATVVESNSGIPLGGVYVRVKDNVKNGSTTDQLGKFTLKVKPKDILILSYIGYIPLVIPASKANGASISLKPDDKALNEVVVIGYGSVQRKDLTGSVAELKVTDMNKAPVASFAQALAGRVAGVTASSPDGQPGVGIDIIIRGGNSLTQSNTPLYVVDGFPIEDFDGSTLNMADIESINILKDASATAVYGARGANGVIVIETKKGQLGKPVIDLSTSYGHQQIQKRMEVMNPYDFVKYQLELSPTTATTMYLSDGKTLEDYRNVEGVNWQENLFRNGSTKINNISIRGGTMDTKYTLSGSYFDQAGTIINSGYKRYQGRFSIDQYLNKKINVGLNTNYSKIETSGQPVASGVGSTTRTYLMSRAWGFRPVSGNNENLLAEEMDDNAIIGQTTSDFRLNPLISTQNDYNKAQTTDLLVNGYFNYKIKPNLVFKVTGGLKSLSRLNDVFYNSKTPQGSPYNLLNLRGVNANTRLYQTDLLSNENILTWDKMINKVHKVKLMGGFSVQSETARISGHSVQNIPNEELRMDGLDEGIPYGVSALSSSRTLVSYYGRFDYNYKSKYLLTATFRGDGSSKFSKDHKWGYFPSAAVAWNMTSEDFIKDIKEITFSKLRLSYGVTGNNRVGDFDYLPSLGFTVASSYSFNNDSPTKGVISMNMGNSDLKWESTRQIDLGYDLGLLKDRIKFTIDAYQKNTYDLLLKAELPTTTGFTFAYKNIGKIENKGLELSLTTVNVKTNSFTWESNFNISFNRNKILALEPGQKEMFSFVSFDTSYNQNPLYVSRIGQPYGMFNGVIFDGIYQLEDFTEKPTGGYLLKDNISTNGADRTTIQPGDIKYKDINGDLVVNTDDRVIMGTPHPKHTGGFSNTFSYKNFDLNVLMQWSYGNQIYNANRIIFDGNGAITEGLNQYVTYNDRWTPDNPSNTHYRTRGGGPNGVYSSNVLEDGSYLRLKTLALGYSFSKTITNKLHLSNLRLNVSAQNLFTITSYTGIDPEVSVRNSNILTPGFDFSPYPMSKTIVFGLNASF